LRQGTILALHSCLVAAGHVLLQLLELAAEHRPGEVAIVLVAEQLRRQAVDGEETLVGCLVARFERSLVDLEHFVDHFEVAVDPVVGEIGSDRAYFRALSDFFKLTLLVVQSGRPHVVLRNYLALRRLLQNLDAFLELLDQLLSFGR